MKVVSINIESVLDEDAAERCGYIATGEIAPFPLHRIVCASSFSVTSRVSGEYLYALESFSRRTMSERAVIAGVEEAVSDASIVLTFNGALSDLPILLTRAMVHEVHVPRLADLQNPSRGGRHMDLFDQVKRDAAPVSLRQLCAPFSIPVKQSPAAYVDNLVADKDWIALARYCETNAVACWLAAQFWNKVQEPGRARKAWRDFARWVSDNADEHPERVPFATVSEPPRVASGPVNLDGHYF